MSRAWYVEAMIGWLAAVRKSLQFQVLREDRNVDLLMALRKGSGGIILYTHLPPKHPVTHNQRHCTWMLLLYDADDC
jgi:hypothetical protein